MRTSGGPGSSHSRRFRWPPEGQGARGVRLPRSFPLQLPSDYLRLVTVGTRALRSLGRALRVGTVEHPDAPELWLPVRDIEGLADRLASLIDDEWRCGGSLLLITGQDVGVLEELLNARDRLALPREDCDALARLQSFLRQYCDLEFDFERPLYLPPDPFV